MDKEDLTKEDTLKLIKEYQQGKKDVGNQIIANNQGLVYSRINEKFYYYLEEKEDLFQIGCLGLSKCLDSYDETKGEFSTYATKFIDTEIFKYIRKTYQDKKNDSLNRVIYKNQKGDKDVTLADLLGYKIDYDDVIYRSEVARHLREIIRKLPEEDRRIIELSYGFNGDDPMSPKDVAKEIRKNTNYVIKKLLIILRELKKQVEMYKTIDSSEYQKTE